MRAASTTTPPVPPWLVLGAGAGATLLTLLAVGDVLVLALTLTAVTGARAGLGPLFACLALGLRTGSISLASAAGAQAVLGPSGLTGPAAAGASAWLGAAALVLAARRGPAAIPLGLAAGFVVAGPAVATPGDLATRVAGGLGGVAAAALLGWMRPARNDRARGRWRWLAWLPELAGGAALLLALAGGAVGGSALFLPPDPSHWLAVGGAFGGVFLARRQAWGFAVGVLTAGAALAGVVPAVWFLGVATLLLVAVPHPGALVVLVPGAVVVLDAAVAGGGGGVTAVGVGLVAVSALGLAQFRRPPRLGRRHLPAVVVGLAVLLTPHLWSWTGIDALDVEILTRSATGVSVAAAGGALAIVAGRMTGRTALPRTPSA